ncbi:MAG: putative glycoside hydrolase [bacterium]|nr:putative glycoside hydrolase [bacterium]
MPSKIFQLAAILVIIFLFALGFCNARGEKTKPPPKSGEIKAIYLGGDYIFSEKKIAELEKILVTTNANGIVIDFKDSNSLSQEYTINLVKRFKKHGAYTIARIVTFQDTGFARKHPEIAIKTSSGDFWYSGRKVWKRYWLDPASELAQDYNIEVAKKAIDAGFDEIQFDYLRFPTDGNMKDIRYPIFNPSKTTKAEVMKEFFAKMKRELKAYSPNTLLGIDVFGEVFLCGKESGIGQTLSDIAEYFDVICPMAYPSHYMCGEFGVQDPTAHPYKVYYVTLQKGLQFLAGKQVIIRPWIQDFTIESIYGCGPTVYYGPDKVRAEIQAGYDLGIKGFMLWNASNNFTIEVLK